MNWKEEIARRITAEEQAVANENVKVHQQLIAEAATRAEKQQAEARRKQAQKEIKVAELRKILEQSGAERLLMKVRDEVWTVGDIDYQIAGSDLDPSIALVLKYFHETAKWELYTKKSAEPRKEPLGGWAGEGDHYGTSYGYGSQDSRWVKARVATSLSIRVYDNLGVKTLGIIDEGWPTGNYGAEETTNYHFIIGGVNLHDAQSLGEGLLQACIERTKANALPLQLAQRGSEHKEAHRIR